MEQLQFDFYEEERKGDFLSCDETCTNFDECHLCVMADHYEGPYAEQIKASADEWRQVLGKVFNNG